MNARRKGAWIAPLVFLSLMSGAGASERACERPWSGSPVGDELGRAGGALVCRDEDHNIQSIELFDYWEQRTLRHLIHFSPNTTDPVRSAKEALSVVRKFSPRRALSYEAFIDRFLTRTEWTDVPAESFDDVCSDLDIPRGCQFDQMIVRRFSDDSNRKEFVVNRALWGALPVNYKGGSILHEAFYEEAIRAGHTDPRKARYFNVLMHSATGENLTDREYARQISAAKFPFWEFRQAFQRSLGRTNDHSFRPEQLVFNTKDELIRIERREGARLELFHPFLGLMEDNPEDHADHYSLFVRRIDMERIPGGEIIRAQLFAREGGGGPFVRLKGQRVELVAPSEIVFDPRSVMHLKLVGCYREPGASQKLCGDVVVDANGAVRAAP